jgi:hypothetical protein
VKDEIINYVRAHPRRTAKEIRAALAPSFPGIRKQDVNKVLYEAQTHGLVTREDTGAAPAWGPALDAATA